MDRSSGSLDALYRTLMRRNSVHIAFILCGALAGERAVNYAFDRIWESNNKGKLYQDIKVLGTRLPEEE